MTINAPQAAARIREALEAGPTPGPWTWWTSCSFRRLSSDATGGDGDVLHGVVQRHDNHPDVQATRATMDFIAAANPAALRAILDRMDELAKDAARLDALTRWDVLDRLDFSGRDREWYALAANRVWIEAPPRLAIDTAISEADAALTPKD